MQLNILFVIEPLCMKARVYTRTIKEWFADVLRTSRDIQTALIGMYLLTQQVISMNRVNQFVDMLNSV